MKWRLMLRRSGTHDGVENGDDGNALPLEPSEIDQKVRDALQTVQLDGAAARGKVALGARHADVAEKHRNVGALHSVLVRNLLEQKKLDVAEGADAALLDHSVPDVGHDDGRGDDRRDGAPHLEVALARVHGGRVDELVEVVELLAGDGLHLVALDLERGVHLLHLRQALSGDVLGGAQAAVLVGVLVDGACQSALDFQELVVAAVRRRVSVGRGAGALDPGEAGHVAEALEGAFGDALIDDPTGTI
ncbi:ribonucleoside-diphosphate reductase subunit alpha [Babesia caballi]|uniref:Ribonucleoside-diphosphate reductase subunit alpha n=1 Tax=Babesia caballi TaxID=5871 RepID=A0AAV4M0I9_BABCB|nr:ribonucleoside-diphosphate reductase subunit alpha [Babesia caballi]